jgi:gas vesicle protein GvpO
VKPTELAREAREAVTLLTGFKAETVTGLSRNGEGWVVQVEALEMKRVPSTMDVLGTYEVLISDDGEVTGLQRRRRHHRSSVEEER